MIEFWDFDMVIDSFGAELSGILESSSELVTAASAFKLFKTTISSEDDKKKFGKPFGRYITYIFDDLSFIDEKDYADLKSSIAQQIKNLTDRLLRGKKKKRALITGIGNPYAVVDSLGPKTVSLLNATRGDEKEHFCEISVISPDVFASTGIKTLEYVKGIITQIAPDIIIAVDSLAARFSDRIGASIQISDAGITPGSALGRRRGALDINTLGIPVIAIGSPTVVSAATLIVDALEKAGIFELTEELEAVLREKKHLYVSSKDCDMIVGEISMLLASSIQLALE